MGWLQIAPSDIFLMRIRERAHMSRRRTRLCPRKTLRMIYARRFVPLPAQRQNVPNGKMSSNNGEWTMERQKVTRVRQTDRQTMENARPMHRLSSSCSYCLLQKTGRPCRRQAILSIFYCARKTFVLRIVIRDNVCNRYHYSERDQISDMT